MQINYNMQLDIDTKGRELKCIANIFFSEPQEDSISFDINNGLKIISITSDHEPIEYEMLKTHLFPYAPYSYSVQILLRKKVNYITVEYSGCIEDPRYDGAIRNDYIELNCYAPWYPRFENQLNTAFEVQISGIEHLSVVKGKYQNEARVWNMQYSSKIDDCPILAVKENRVITKQAGNLICNVHDFHLLAKDRQDIIAKNLEPIIKFYEGIIHPIEFRDEEFNFIITKTSGGGYCRDMIIVVSRDWPKDIIKESWRLIALQAHEMAHLWWYGADTSSMHDWLNESFAEYCAYLYLESIGYNTATECMIEEYKKQADACPPIASIEYGSPIYNSRFKGVLILHEYREKFGIDALYKVFSILYNIEEKDTYKLVDAIRTQIGENYACFFESRINK